MKQLVFVHGRSQEKKDAVALKAEWMKALGEGLAKYNLEMPIPEPSVRFPYYGQTLYDLVNDADVVADVIVRGGIDAARAKIPGCRHQGSAGGAEDHGRRSAGSSRERGCPAGTTELGVAAGHSEGS